MKRDWTCDKSGASNSSEVFERMAGAVEQIIRESGPALINGHVGAVARLIIAQLAHVHGMAPR